MKAPLNKRRPRQLPLAIPTWGGRRKNAGRKPKNGKAGVTHTPRPELDAKLPLHVTLRVAPHVWSLRSERSWSLVAASLRDGADRFGVRIVQLSVQGNHIHCMVEAPTKRALSSAMRGLSIRLARRMNALMGRRGPVIADRYHARALRTPTEVRNTIHYIRNNRRHHLGERAAALRLDFVDRFSADRQRSDGNLIELPRPSLWLLREGWRRGRATHRPSSPQQHR